MTDASAPTPVSAMPTYADTLIATLIAGAGAGLVKTHTLNQAQLTDVVGALMTLIGVTWQVINANPSKQSPIAMLMAILGKVSPAQQQAWNGAVKAAEAAIEARLIPIIHAQVKAHAGILAGPVDGLADKALSQAADTLAGAVEVPAHLKIS